MSFEDLFKGSIAVELVTLLLTEAGCEVSRNGVESRLPLRGRVGPSLRIPTTLRRAPDLVVTSLDGEVRPFEVKFRKTWNPATRKSLFGDKRLKEQVRLWGDVYLLVVVAQPPITAESLSLIDHIRLLPMCLTPDSSDIQYSRFVRDKSERVFTPARHATWNALIKPQNSNFFQAFNPSPEASATACKVLRSLA